VGRYIDLDGKRQLVVGVLPPFSLLLPAEAFLVKDADVWKPLQLDYTRAPAQEEMSQIAQRLRQEHAVHAGSNMRIRVVPLHDDIVKAAREPLRVLAL